MRRVPTMALVLAASLALAAAPALGEGGDDSGGGGEAGLLANVRQLTYEGRRAGEGYFSADGGSMIFQSERQPGNPFYQMYLIDLWNGEVRRLSPGHGKTTCGWLHPGRGKAMFSSTHDDPGARDKQKAELDFRASGKQRRYSWDFDAGYEIYEVDLETGALRNLTNAPGYDAEGSYSPDGRLIAFASNRHAYTDRLGDAEAGIFERDKSSMMDIYMMNADGTGVRRLTDAPGYDGGPFFAPDGERIVWRRFSEDGATAEVFTMNIDGTDQRQITRLGAMSWAPFYHPSGDYVVFATNLHGFANFELYAVDTEGLGEPVRVTDSEGFDGLPAFSPDGRRLAWTNRRAVDGTSQIFIADWNDAEMRRRLGLGAGRPLAKSIMPPPKIPPIEADAIRRHVARLASEEMAGRLTGSDGARLAADYIAGVFRDLGLEPAGDDGTYFQAFPFTAGARLGSANRLAVGGETPVLDRDWRPLAFSASGTFEPAGIVFAGYGIVAPAAGEFAATDSYGDLDVAGKWVMVLRFLPEDVGPGMRRHLLLYTELQYKAAVARRKGAAGLIVVSGPNSGVAEQLVGLSLEAGGGVSAIPAVSIGDDLAGRLLAAAGRDLGRLQDALDAGQAVAGLAIPGIEVGGDIDLVREQRTGRNVLARLRATSPAAEPDAPEVVVGAHYDHLGRGEAGGSLSRDKERGKVHFGADDNAAGVAGVLEIAERLTDLCGCGGVQTYRNLLFAAWSGEELGVLGSTHFAESLAGEGGEEGQEGQEGQEGGLAAKVAAYLNMDMIGRLRDRVYLQGTGSSPAWPGLIERGNVPVGLAVAPGADSYLPTDTTPFYLGGVPVLNAFTGAHADYSSPRDTADRINHAGAARVADLIGTIAMALARSKEAPEYVRQERPKGSIGRRHLRVYLGTIPDYGEDGIRGVRLSGTAKGGPAEAAGLEGGDVIVGLAGAGIDNIYDLVEALGGLKAGKAVDVTVLRDGVKTTLTITPAARE